MLHARIVFTQVYYPGLWQLHALQIIERLLREMFISVDEKSTKMVCNNCPKVNF